MLRTWRFHQLIYLVAAALGALPTSALAYKRQLPECVYGGLLRYIEADKANRTANRVELRWVVPVSFRDDLYVRFQDKFGDRFQLRDLPPEGMENVTHTLYPERVGNVTLRARRYGVRPLGTRDAPRFSKNQRKYVKFEFKIADDPLLGRKVKKPGIVMRREDLLGSNMFVRGVQDDGTGILNSYENYKKNVEKVREATKSLTNAKGRTINNPDLVDEMLDVLGRIHEWRASRPGKRKVWQLNERGEYAMDFAEGLTPVESTQYARRAYKFMAEVETPQGKKLSEVQLTFDKDIEGKTLGKLGAPDARYDPNERIVEFKMDEAYYKMSDAELLKISPELYWAREQSYKMDMVATKPIGKGKRNLLEADRIEQRSIAQRFYDYAFEDRLPKTFSKIIIGTAVFGGLRYAYSARDEREAKRRWSEVREAVLAEAAGLKQIESDLRKETTIDGMDGILRRIGSIGTSMESSLEYVRVMDRDAGAEIEAAAEEAAKQLEKSLNALAQSTRMIVKARKDGAANLADLEEEHAEVTKRYARSAIEFALYSSIIDDTYLSSLERKSLAAAAGTSDPKVLHKAFSTALAEAADLIVSSIEATDQKMRKSWIWPGK